MNPGESSSIARCAEMKLEACRREVSVFASGLERRKVSEHEREDERRGGHGR
jgi:hypothetical protein